MNNGLKFRIWVVKQKQMLTMDGWGVVALRDLFAKAAGFEVNSELIIMQRCEFQDKNSREIYEGDIVKYSGYLNDAGLSNYGIVRYGTADWFDGCCDRLPATGFYVDCYDKSAWEYLSLGEGSCDNIEVVGNIYENKPIA